MSQAGTISSGSGGSGITQVTTDVGIATPIAGNLSILAETGYNNGTVFFTASTDTVNLRLDDFANGNLGLGSNSLGANITSGTTNVCVGSLSGFGIISGSNNSSLGYESLEDITTGSFNCAVGTISLATTTASSYSTCIGYATGNAYRTTESSNILIGYNVVGTLSESNTLRIGVGTGTGNGQLSSTYIQGIAGVTTSNSNFVTIDTTTGQLGATASGGSGIVTIDGDTGSATGSTITFNAQTLAGSSVDFGASGSTVFLSVTDANDNTIIGLNGGSSGSLTGTANTGFGHDVYAGLTIGSFNSAIGEGALASLISGDYNNAIGQDALDGLISGGSNQAIGFSAGSAYTGSESSNILIGDGVTGTIGESNTLRIGLATGTGTGNLSSAYIQGIAGVTTSNTNMVTIDTTTGQLGSTASASSGALQLIQTQTATAQAALTFTTGIASPLNIYFITAYDVSNATIGVSTISFLVQISIDGGATYISTGYTGSPSSNGFPLGHLVGSASLATSNAYIYNLTSNTGNIYSLGNSLALNISGSPLSVPTFCFYSTASTLVNAIQVVMEDGSDFSGTFSLYSVAS